MKRIWKKRWFRLTLLGSAMALVLSAGLIVYLLQLSPAAWRQSQVVLDSATPVMREKITKDVKQRIADLAQATASGFQALHQQAGEPSALTPKEIADTPLDEFVELKLTNAELVLIVNDFFVKWTQQRGYIIPGGINDPAVIADNGKLMMAFMIDTPLWHQVFSGEVSLSFKPDGLAIGKVKGLHAGSLPIPMLTIAKTLRLMMPASEHETADRLGRWLAKLDHFEFRPTIEMQHRRRARVVAMDVGDQDVTVRLRVQDHRTYRAHNDLLGLGEMAVTDVLESTTWDGSRFADVPTTTD